MQTPDKKYASADDKSAKCYSSFALLVIYFIVLFYLIIVVWLRLIDLAKCLIGKGRLGAAALLLFSLLQTFFVYFTVCRKVFAIIIGRLIVYN